MKEEFDTSWFDLKKYDKLKEIKLNDWISLFESRNSAYLHSKSGGDFYFRLVTDPVCNFFIGNNDYFYPFDTFSVKSTSLAEFALLKKSQF